MPRAEGRHEGGIDSWTIDGPPVQLFAASSAVDATKELRSITLPDDPRFEVYALTLE